MTAVCGKDVGFGVPKGGSYCWGVRSGNLDFSRNLGSLEVDVRGLISSVVCNGIPAEPVKPLAFTLEGDVCLALEQELALLQCI